MSKSILNSLTVSHIASHPGIVEQVTAPASKSRRGSVFVKIEVISACATCHSHSSCTFAEKKDKVVEVETDAWQDYAVGDNVTVSIDEGLGLKAVFLAYVLPSLLLLTTFLVLYFTIGELWSALGTLLCVGLYWYVLLKCRNRLQKQFTFTLTKD